MKRIIFNEKNIKEEDIEFEAIRVKGIIINSNKEILLAHNNATYQFIGGHVEQDEDIKDALIREIKEETGITDIKVEEPFMLIENYTDEYFNMTVPVHGKIYYYKIETDAKPDLNLTDYDVLERQTDFKLFYVNLYSMKDFLNDALKKNMIEKDIYNEMFLVIEEFIKLYREVI